MVVLTKNTDLSMQHFTVSYLTVFCQKYDYSPLPVNFFRQAERAACQMLLKMTTQGLTVSSPHVQPRFPY